MTTMPEKSAASANQDTLQYYGNVSPIFEYWCLECDEFFETRELLSECPDCKSNMQDNLVQIYMDHDPVPEMYKTRKDWGEGG